MHLNYFINCPEARYNIYPNTVGPQQTSKMTSNDFQDKTLYNNMRVPHFKSVIFRLGKVMQINSNSLICICILNIYFSS